MRNARECFSQFEAEKNSGLTTETALKLVFHTMRFSVKTLNMNVFIPDKTIFVLTQKMYVEWNKFIKYATKKRYGPIPKKSFERFNRESNPDYHKVWLSWRAKKNR